ncbi:hypothetical protein Fmac_025037 [Flemingia macrophylla]|uniref:Uncharacterized protein n=1 Tax=Flemingia macrophylla TaxID=520843 RepID=A0ABD1LR37_9FABA
MEYSNGDGEKSRKRFYTKFSAKQKEKMLALVEKLGWKLQKSRHDKKSFKTANPSSITCSLTRDPSYVGPLEEHAKTNNGSILLQRPNFFGRFGKFGGSMSLKL